MEGPIIHIGWPLSVQPVIAKFTMAKLAALEMMRFKAR